MHGDCLEAVLRRTQRLALVWITVWGSLGGKWRPCCLTYFPHVIKHKWAEVERKR